MAPEAGVGRVPGNWRSAGESGMHTVVVFTHRSRHEAVLGAWLADAVRRGQKVLVLPAPEEDGSLLDRLLAAAALDPSWSAPEIPDICYGS